MAQSPPPAKKSSLIRDKPFRIRPLKPRHPGRDGVAKAFFTIQRLARRGPCPPKRGIRLAFQRVTVKLNFIGQQSRHPKTGQLMQSSWKSFGQYRNYGKYIGREEAAASLFAAEAPELQKSGVERQLQEWQDVGDRRLWRIIVSPENTQSAGGKELDWNRFVTDTMRQIETDLGLGRLQWVAAVHTNTDHPHAHIALRGIDGNGKMFRIPADYIRSGRLRLVASNALTNQLGLAPRKEKRQELQLTQAKELHRHS